MVANLSMVLTLTVESSFTNDKQLEKWKEYFTTVFNHITSCEVPFLVDEMASRRNMRIRTAPRSGREFISAINAPKRSKTIGLDGLFTELFIGACSYGLSATLSISIYQCKISKEFHSIPKSESVRVSFLLVIGDVLNVASCRRRRRVDIYPRTP